MEEQNIQEYLGHEKDSNTRTMLKYFKLYLGRITYDQEHLLKEYRKSLQYLNSADQVELKRWMDVNNELINT